MPVVALRRLNRASLLLPTVVAACVESSLVGLLRADTTATWTASANSVWSDASKWSTNPLIPDNSGGTLYDAVVESGAISLDISPEIQLLSMSSSTLSGPGKLTVNGLFTFKSSTLATAVIANGGISISNTNVTILGGALTNAAGQTTTFVDSNLFLQTGSAFINNGAFVATGFIDLLLDSVNDPGTFINNNQLIVNVTNSLNFNAAFSFVNNGTLSVVHGAANIGVSTTGPTGSVVVSAGGTVGFVSGNRVFLPTNTIVGSGNVTFSTSGTVTLGCTYDVSGTTTLANGTLLGTQTLAGPLVWAGHTIRGVINAAGGISIANTNVTLQGGTLTNAAGQNTTISDSAIFLQTQGGIGGHFVNNGIFNATGSRATLLANLGTAGTFTNNGIMNISVTNTMNILSGFNFVNNGTLSVKSAITLIGTNDSGSSGTFLVAAGATMKFPGGNHNFMPASTIAGAGDVVFTTGGTVTLGGRYSVSGTTLFMSGFMLGAQTIAGPLVLDNNTILGAIVANGGITITNTNVSVSGGSLTNNAGQTTTLQSSSIFLQTPSNAGGIFINNGIFNATGSTDTLSATFGTLGSFLNNGLLSVTVSNAMFINSSITFNNAGTLTAGAGTVGISSNGTHTGKFINAGGFIVFSGGTQLFNSGTSIAVLSVGGGSDTFSPGVALTPGGSMTLTGGTTILASGDAVPTKLSALSITNNNAQLDLTTSRLIVQATDSADKTTRIGLLVASVNHGANGVDWNGNGITSSTAAADKTHLGVGLFDNALLGLTTFGGTTSVDANSILVAVAHLGDANHNGVVDIQDQSLVTSNWQSSQNNWAAGDLNLDGLVDLQDLTMVTNNWQQSSNFSQFNSSLDAGAAANGSAAAVPEPATLALLVAGIALLPRRRRNPWNFGLA